MFPMCFCIPCTNLPNHKLYEGQEVTHIFFKLRAITLVDSVCFEACQILEYIDLIFQTVSNCTVAQYLSLSNDFLNMDNAKDILCVLSKGKGPIFGSIEINPISFPTLHSFQSSLLVADTGPSSLAQKASRFALLILITNRNPHLTSTDPS